MHKLCSQGNSKRCVLQYQEQYELCINYAVRETPRDVQYQEQYELCINYAVRETPRDEELQRCCSRLETKVRGHC